MPNHLHSILQLALLLVNLGFLSQPQLVNLLTSLDFPYHLLLVILLTHSALLQLNLLLQLGQLLRKSHRLPTPVRDQNSFQAH